MSLRARWRAAPMFARWFVVLVWLGRAHAEARPAGVAADYASVAYAASDAEADALELTLKSSLNLPNLECEVRRVPSVDPRALLVPEHETRTPLARIWVDLTRAEHALVYIIDGPYAHVYIRSLPRATSRALDHAQVGEIVRSAVQALQEGAVIGIARATAVGAATPARASTAAHEADTGASEMLFGAGLLYGVGLRASGAELAQGPGVYGYGLHQLHGLGLGALLTAQYQPLRITDANARASLDTLALRAGPLFESRLSPPLALRAALALGMDVVQIAPSARNSSVLADSSRLAAFPLLEVAVGVRARLSAHLELLASAAIDVELVDTRYVVQSAHGLTVVEDPFPIRPWLLVGLGFF